MKKFFELHQNKFALMKNLPMDSINYVEYYNIDKISQTVNYFLINISIIHELLNILEHNTKYSVIRVFTNDYTSQYKSTVIKCHETDVSNDTSIIPRRENSKILESWISLEDIKSILQIYVNNNSFINC